MGARSYPAAGPVAVTNSRSATREPSGTRRRAKPAPAGALLFPRTCRILRSAEFRVVYDKGIRFSDRFFVAFCLARTGSDEGARLGLTVPRAIGGAVVRNRIKRRLRDFFRHRRAEIGARWDIVVNPRRAAIDANFAELERAFQKVVEKCG